MSIFEVTSFQEQGRQLSVDKSEIVRIVCNTAQGEVLAIWGTLGVNTSNVEKIEDKAKSGFPFQIDCTLNTNPPPKSFQDQYGHTHWVADENRLHIL